MVQWLRKTFDSDAKKEREKKGFHPESFLDPILATSWASS